MILTLDSESHLIARAYLAFVKSGPGYLYGLARDAFSTGMLSAGTEPNLRRELARTDVVLDGPEVELTFVSRGRDDPEPRARHLADALAASLSLPVEAVYLAAIRVGLRIIFPAHLMPKETP